MILWNLTVGQEGIDRDCNAYILLLYLLLLTPQYFKKKEKESPLLLLRNFLQWSGTYKVSQGTFPSLCVRIMTTSLMEL